MTVQSREKEPFSPQNPNFDSPMPKFDSKVYPNISKHEKTHKSISNLSQNILLTKSSFDPFFIKLQKQHKFIANFTILITQGFNHQPHHLSTTTTINHHEFINNSSQQHLISSFLDKNAKHTYNHNLSM
jgi:hypothetical protein